MKKYLFFKGEISMSNPWILIISMLTFLGGMQTVGCGGEALEPESVTESSTAPTEETFQREIQASCYGVCRSESSPSSRLVSCGSYRRNGRLFCCCCIPGTSNGYCVPGR